MFNVNNLRLRDVAKNFKIIQIVDDYNKACKPLRPAQNFLLLVSAFLYEHKGDDSMECMQNCCSSITTVLNPGESLGLRRKICEQPKEIFKHPRTEALTSDSQENHSTLYSVTGDSPFTNNHHLLSLHLPKGKDQSHPL